MEIKIIDGTALSQLCDYSFGDQIGALEPSSAIGGFMKDANDTNQEFLTLAKSFEGKVMKLFIDNIRLYWRPIKVDSLTDLAWVNYLMEEHNLLALCASLPQNQFIIYTSHEDTPIDERIELPPNVLKIYAVNAIYHTDRIVPFPYGLQRQISANDHRLKVMQSYVDEEKGKTIPTKLLYMNCAVNRSASTVSRLAIKEKFEGQPFATVRTDANNRSFPLERYSEYLDEILDHKFMVCPWGHISIGGLDCHRNWETLYLRRVPVMEAHPYLTRLMEGLPVLFVDSFQDVTAELLLANEALFQTAQTFDLKRLDLHSLYGRD